MERKVFYTMRHKGDSPGIEQVEGFEFSIDGNKFYGYIDNEIGKAHIVDPETGRGIYGCHTGDEYQGTNAVKYAIDRLTEDKNILEAYGRARNTESYRLMQEMFKSFMQGAGLGEKMRADGSKAYHSLTEETGTGNRQWTVSRKEGKKMDNQGLQTGQLLENGAAREFLQLLAENSPGMGVAFSMMLWQMDSMEKQLNMALAELREVKGQLAGMQENPAKPFVSSMADAVEGRLYGVREHLAELKGRIVDGAREAVEGFGRAGVKALDQAVSALGIKKALESMQKDIGESITDVKKSIEKVEGLGHELRSVGGHIKNVGRTMVGKERQDIDGGSEGRFQAAVLSPLRMEKIFLDRLNNIALSAIGKVERLEQAAAHVKKEAALETETGRREASREKGGPEDLKYPSDKGKEKPSVLKELQGKKAQAASRPSPALAKGTKSHEAAL